MTLPTTHAPISTSRADQAAWTPAASGAGTAEPRTLYVAATGGHLKQLNQLSKRIPSLGRPLWVTFSTPQSRSLLEGEDVIYVRFTAPRDVKAVLANLSAAREIFDEHNIVECVSTGSAIALSFLPRARLRGIPCHYVESAARSEGPSITGRALSAVPGVKLYCQYGTWQSRRWRLAGSVFDEFKVAPEADVDGERLKVVVMTGTLDYRFDRFIKAVQHVAQPGWDITWQLGPNDYGDLPGETYGLMESARLSELCREADLVISHAGVGSALTALEAGKQPILVAREKEEGEHVDDHQRFIARELSDRGLARAAVPGELTTELLTAAARHRVVHVADAGPIALRR